MSIEPTEQKQQKTTFQRSQRREVIISFITLLHNLIIK